MLGLTVDKLIVITVIAAFVIGPTRLPEYAQRLARLVREGRAYVEVLLTRAQEELQVPLDRAGWDSLDPRQYDPRRIVRDALSERAPGTTAVRGDGEGATARAGTEPRVTFVVTGTSGHPRRTVAPVVGVTEEVEPVAGTLGTASAVGDRPPQATQGT
ncbi:Sec-independent protein translocase TatB [Actinotalea sp. BY-33]|uniref:Sec-independent protein translocase TatB n=1 Tax=Actinotalea soli TaxID=2819234 RepID=A0A939LQW5_9CELL|nr:Sec-independent protein translocase TatB [Actinotalea soli]MBO1752163.1 Sec-independent protein translocase TatB [Actinotalea soli]